MRLTPHEVEKTTVLMGVCALAQKRLASVLRLNLPEAEGLIAGQLIHLARDIEMQRLTKSSNSPPR